MSFFFGGEIVSVEERRLAAAASPGVLYFLGLPRFLFTDSERPPEDTVEGTAWEE